MMTNASLLERQLAEVETRKRLKELFEEKPKFTLIKLYLILYPRELDTIRTALAGMCYDGKLKKTVRVRQDGLVTIEYYYLDSPAEQARA